MHRGLLTGSITPSAPEPISKTASEKRGADFSKRDAPAQTEVYWKYTEGEPLGIAAEKSAPRRNEFLKWVLAIV